MPDTAFKPVTDSSSTMTDALILLRNWLRSPRKVATAVPSSPFLAKAMAATIADPDAGFFLELGGGTGSITRAALDAGVPREKLLVVEANEEMARVLKRRFPGIHVLEQDARLLDRTLSDLGVQRLAGVLSSLPMLNMDGATQLAILQAFAPLLAPAGHLAQYTYGWRCPLDETVLQTLQWERKRQAFVLANIPPAHVWTFRPQTRD
jgi:phosphatidylethanolamine/phosphatidyl-N-methylethanolamine N-methyltransferase